MSERKPANESWESFTERRIREAQADGSFSGLPGFGKPIPGIDQPLDDNWWIRKKLREEQLSVVPPVLEARLKRQQFLDRLNTVGTEARVRQLVDRLNEEIRRAQYSPTPGPADGVQLLDVDQVLEDWRSQRTTRGTIQRDGSAVHDE